MTTHKTHSAAARYGADVPTVMIVEDDCYLGPGLAEILGYLGYEADLIDDGANAVARIAATQPDVILLDIHLPGRSGMNILREVSSNAALRDTATIVITADTTVRASVTSLADAVLIKPFTIAEMSRAVLNVLALTRAGRSAAGAERAADPRASAQI